MKNILLSLPYRKIILGLGIWFLGFLGVSFAQYEGNDYCTFGDLMQQAFCMANMRDNIIDLGNTKTAVGGVFFQGETEIKLKLWRDPIKIGQKGSIVVRITRFALMLTIVLAVTMIIFNGMQYIIKSGTGEDPKKVQTNLVYVVVGIILALLSVVLINLLRSTGHTLYKEASGSVSISHIDTSSLV